MREVTWSESIGTWFVLPGERHVYVVGVVEAELPPGVEERDRQGELHFVHDEGLGRDVLSELTNADKGELLEALGREHARLVEVMDFARRAGYRPARFGVPADEVTQFKAQRSFERAIGVPETDLPFHPSESEADR